MTKWKLTPRGRMVKQLAGDILGALGILAFFYIWVAVLYILK